MEAAETEKPVVLENNSITSTSPRKQKELRLPAPIPLLSDRHIAKAKEAARYIKLIYHSQVFQM